jgi:uncharacterized protein (TIGR03067 family)
MKQSAVMVAVGLLFAANEPTENVVKKEMAQFQGTWKFVSMEVEGKKKPDDDIRFTVIVQGDQWRSSILPALPGQFRLDPTRNPKTIDFVLSKERVAKGIYSVDKDKLTVCYRFGQDNGERPSAFSTGPNSRLALYVLTRQAKPYDSDEAFRQEMAQFQGTWKFISMEVDGKKNPEQDFKQHIVVLKNDRWTVSDGDKVAAQVMFNVNPAKNPKTIELIDVKNRRLIRGIYTLEADTLTVCDRGSEKGDRPTEFGTKPGTGLVKFLLKRVKH